MWIADAVGSSHGLHLAPDRLRSADGRRLTPPAGHAGDDTRQDVRSLVVGDRHARHQADRSSEDFGAIRRNRAAFRAALRSDLRFSR